MTRWIKVDDIELKIKNKKIKKLMVVETIDFTSISRELIKFIFLIVIKNLIVFLF